MKAKSNISAYILRGAVAGLLVSCVIVALSSAINLPNKRPKVPAPENDAPLGVDAHERASSAAAPGTCTERTLTFADRVAYQHAIEEVYWRHRIWPKANAAPKPPLDKVMSQAEIEKKVEDYLRNSQALEDYWQRPITPDQLQAEMERIASHTKQPEVLRELFAALGNDRLVIAECLARPVLAERLLTELYAHDQRFHGELKRRSEAELRTHRSVSQMKQTSGLYTEMEWIKSDTTDLAPSDVPGVVATPLRGVAPNVPQARGYSERHDTPDAIRMNGSDWQESVQKLAQDFGNTKAKDPYSQIKTGVLSPLQEDDGHYYAVAVMKKGKDRLKLATVVWLKEPLRSWLAKAEAQVPVTMAAVSPNYTLPVIASPSDNSSPSVNCTDDTWTPTSLTNAPAARYRHTAVWTGSEMIVWGGYVNGIVNTGGRYNPSTDSWTATSLTDAPSARELQTAVWTGSQMIVWGGSPYFFNTGGRYNPGTDTWAATSTTGAPSGREFHTAVWTGSQMIVWGGNGGDNTGGRYNPSTDSWTATSTTNAPAAPRWYPTAVWTGSEMIVWGGFYGSNFFKTGGRYNPSTDSWAATSITGAPAGRDLHTAVWTGSEMIVWGGDVSNNNPSNTGGRYNPSSNSWTATSLTNAPSARELHTAVWTGNEMIVWGGDDTVSVFNTGRRYNPGTDSWTATSLTNAPAARELQTAVWTGSQMIVWGGGGSSGLVKTGGRYCAQSGATPPVITSPTTATTTQGQLFVYQVIATGTPTSYSAVPVPAGMSFDSVRGILGGTPTSPGTTQIHLTATNSFGTGMKTLTFTIRPAPNSGPVIMSGTSITARTGMPFSFEVFTTRGDSSARLTATGLPPGLSADPVTGVISGTPTSDGSFGVTLTVRDGAVTFTSTLQLTFTSDPAIPVITSSRETALAAGRFFTYTIVAPGHTTFSLIGTLPPGLHFDAATGTISGTFNPIGDQNGGALLGNVQLVRTNSSGTGTNPLSFFQGVPATAKNISTRLAVGTNDNVLIGGFIVTGNASKKVIVRAIGPELGAPPYNIPNALADPTLELHDHTGAVIASNDNWMNASNKQEIINSGHAPSNDLESAILTTLAPGNYTAIIRGKNGTTGNALVEVYDLGTASLDVSSNAQLGNISTRGLVQTGDNVMIGGFIVQGDMPATVIVRAIGPNSVDRNTMSQMSCKIPLWSCMTTPAQSSNPMTTG